MIQNCNIKSIKNLHGNLIKKTVKTINDTPHSSPLIRKLIILVLMELFKTEGNVKSKLLFYLSIDSNSRKLIDK